MTALKNTPKNKDSLPDSAHARLDQAKLVSELKISRLQHVQHKTSRRLGLLVQKKSLLNKTSYSRPVSI